MFNTLLTWKRGDTIIQQHLLADIQDMDVPEARDLQAQSPTDAFWIFTNYDYDIRKDDVLVNEANTSEVYRVFARVRKYPGHAEIPAELNSLDKQHASHETKAEESASRTDQAKNDFLGTIQVSPEQQFEQLIHDLLQNLGYRVEATPRRYDLGYDFVIYRSASTLENTTVEQIWLVELKYTNITRKVGLDIVRQLYAYSLQQKPNKGLLITNSRLSSEARLFVIQHTELEVWDADKLRQLLAQFPELKKRYPGVVSRLNNPIDEEELAAKTTDGQHELIRELKKLPTGDGKAYEDLVKRILEFCFHDEFRPFAVNEQVRTLNGKRIRDFIIDNRNSKMQFWKDIKWIRKVEQILFDAKNYKDPVEYREISDTLRYLKNEAFGNFIIVISRCGVKDYLEAVEDYGDKKQVTLFLADDDLVKMINLKLAGESPTLLIEDRYYEFLKKK